MEKGEKKAFLERQVHQAFRDTMAVRENEVSLESLDIPVQKEREAWMENQV
ncbi:MAG: hypothetical protein NHF95_00025 [Candidatus Shikimatogenerans sp. JK-2022]|nr:hypothetical protein [Candidatus Shikimatogenerans bostrichidophilus]